MFDNQLICSDQLVRANKMYLCWNIQTYTMKLTLRVCITWLNWKMISVLRVIRKLFCVSFQRS